jgi:hypothetical protein
MNRTWEVLRAPETATERSSGLVNLPLGIAELTGYDQFGVQLRRGDLLLFYTDSLIETRMQDGRVLGEAGLLEIVRSIDASKPELLIARLIEQIAARRAGVSPEDDVTVLLLRDTGIAPRFQSGLLAPFRIAGSMIRSFIGGEPSTAGLPEVSLPSIVGAVVPAVSRRWRPKGLRRGG